MQKPKAIPTTPIDYPHHRVDLRVVDREAKVEANQQYRDPTPKAEDVEDMWDNMPV